MQSHPASRIATLASVALALSACESMRVTTDTNATARMTDCRSFAWLEPDVMAQRNGNAAFDNPVNNQRLRTAVAQKLSAHGVQPVAGGGAPDCLVAHAIGTRHAGTYGPIWGYGLGTGWGGYPYHGYGAVGFSSGDSRDYREGRVTVDIYRAGNREALWHADADVDITGLRGADADKRIDKIVTAIFAHYPSS